MRSFLRVSVLFLVAFVFLGTCFLSGVRAQEGIKIGVIDIKEVVNNCKYGQDIMSQLQLKYDELKAKLQQELKKLNELKTEIQQKSALWSKEEKQKKEKEYNELLNKIKELQQASEIEIQSYQQKLLQPLFVKLEKVIKDFAQKQGYDLILEKKQPGLYYASNKIDITGKIINILDKMYEKEKESSNSTDSNQ